MKSVILDATENNNYIEEILKQQLEKCQDEVSYYKLKDKNIMPCRACGACSNVEPGLCALKDDMQEVLRDIAKGERIIMLTPIVFGGYSSLLKRAVDRFMVLGLPFLFVKKGKLLHPMRYGTKAIIGIGIAGEGPMGQEENFKLVVERNALNMQSPYKAIIFKASEDRAKIENELDIALKGVN